MEEILFIIISFVGQLLLESLLYFPWDIFMVSYEKKREGDINTFGWLFISLIIGIAVGAASVAILSSAVIPISWLRVINLIVAPFLAGAVALRMSKRRNQKGLTSNNKLHYLVSFFFTLGILGIRFVLTTKT